MLRDRRHQRRRGRVRVFPAQQIDGAAAAEKISQIGRAAAPARYTAKADVLLKEKAHRLLHRGDRVSRRPVVAVQGTVQQAAPIRSGMRVLAQNLGRLIAAAGFATQPNTWSKLRPVSAAAWKNAWITFAASAA